MTSGWATILTSTVGVAGIAGTSVTAWITQHSTTKRELMLAKHERHRELVDAQRDAVKEMLTFIADFRQDCLDNIAELWSCIFTYFLSDAREKFQPQIEALTKAYGDKARIPPYLLDESNVPTPLPDGVSEEVKRLAGGLNRHMVAITLIVTDSVLRDALTELKEKWTGFAQSWYELHSLAKNWTSKKGPGGEFPLESVAEPIRKYGEMATAISDFHRVSTDYFVRNMNPG